LTLWEKNDRIYKLLVKAKNPGDVIVKGIGYSSLFRDSGLCGLIHQIDAAHGSTSRSVVEKTVAVLGMAVVRCDG
jgi:hypothetical protein